MTSLILEHIRTWGTVATIVIGVYVAIVVSTT